MRKRAVRFFYPPYWWPAPVREASPQENRPVVLFLDERGRARPEILQAVQDLTLNKTLAGKALPPGSIVIAAVNSGEEYQLTELDPALVSRFNLYEFVPTVEDWLLWAAGQDIDSRVLTFIQQHPEYLDGDNPDADFCPVLAYLDEHRDYDGLIIYTDGYAPCPAPPQNRRTRILWLFVSEAHYRSCYPKLQHLGQGVYLKCSAREMPNPVI